MTQFKKAKTQCGTNAQAPRTRTGLKQRRLNLMANTIKNQLPALKWPGKQEVHFGRREESLFRHLNQVSSVNRNIPGSRKDRATAGSG
jgi:hypothetical protein